MKQDRIKYKEMSPKMADYEESIEVIKEESLQKLGYFLKPEELFGELARRGNGDNEEKVLLK